MQVFKDPRGRPGKWRVRNNGKDRIVTADTAENALVVASRIDWEPESDNKWLELVDIHIERRHEHMKGRPKWTQYRYQLRKFAREFITLCTPDNVEMGHFLTAWDLLTRHQQDNLKPELNRFVKWAMLSGAIKLHANPIDLLDKKPVPSKKRDRLTLDVFQKVLTVAKARGFDGLVGACKLGLITCLRRGDLADLTWEDVVDGELQVTVNKSEAVRGSIKAARLKWKLSNHPDLVQVLKELKTVAMMNRDCPYILSHFTVNQRGKTHPCQMTGDMITKQFTECVRIVLPDSDNYPTFHEVRSLAAALLEKQGVSDDKIKTIMAHTDVDTTYLYLRGHERRFTEVHESVLFADLL